jgi:hypothetical protein
MLRLTFRDSDLTWDLEPGDEITVGEHTFRVADLAKLQMLDVEFGVKRGIVQTGADALEVVGPRWLDETSGIEVEWPIPADSVPAVIDTLTAKQVRVARTMPESLDASAA